MRLSTLLLLIVAAGILAVVAVSNSGIVVFRLDPFSAEHPALAFSLPLYQLVFLALLLGVVLGGATVALSRGRKPANAALRPLAPDISALPARATEPKPALRPDSQVGPQDGQT